MTSQLTIFDTPPIPGPVRDAIRTRLKHLPRWTMELYLERAYVCRVLWPEYNERLKWQWARRQFRLRAEELRGWLERKGDPSRRHWVELAMLEYLAEAKT